MIELTRCVIDVIYIIILSCLYAGNVEIICVKRDCCGMIVPDVLVNGAGTPKEFRRNT